MSDDTAGRRIYDAKRRRVNRSLMQDTIRGTGIRQSFQQGVVHPWQQAKRDLQTLGHAAFGSAPPSKKDMAVRHMARSVRDPYRRFALAREIYGVTLDDLHDQQLSTYRKAVAYAVGGAAFAGYLIYYAHTHDTATTSLTAAGFGFVALYAFVASLCASLQNFVIRRRVLLKSGNTIKGLWEFVSQPREWLPRKPAPRIITGRADRE